MCAVVAFCIFCRVLIKTFAGFFSREGEGHERSRLTNIMMVAGLLRLLATSGVFLLPATVFTSSVPRAGASSTAPAPAAAESNDDTTTDICPAELLACDEDPTCFACISVTETSSTEFWECEAAAAASSASSSPATDEACAEGRQAMCCINEASEFDCMANGVYLDYVTCLLAETGCSIEDVSCPGEGGSNNAGDMTLDASHGAASSNGAISGTSIAVTLAFAFVFFAAGVSVGVVMSMKFMPGSHPFTRIK